MFKRVLLAILLSLLALPGYAAEQVKLKNGYFISLYPGGKTTNSIGSQYLTEDVSKRTASTKTYKNGKHGRVSYCWNANAPIHYKDDYSKDVEWKEVDPTHYVDKGSYLEFSHMPYTVKVFKHTYSYEIIDRRTNDMMSAKLIELDDEAANISKKAELVDFDVHVLPNGVRFWKHTKEGGPTKFKWLIKNGGPNPILKFRHIPEAKTSENKSVVVQTSKEHLEDGFYWTEQVPLTNISIDTDFTADTVDRYIYGSDSDYATARSTADTNDNTGGFLFVGQSCSVGGEDTIYRSFISFDTSSLVGVTVTQANLRLVATYNYSTTDFDVQIIKQDWSDAGGTDDSNYDGCLAGTADDSIWRNTSGMSINTQYTSGNLDITYVNVSGGYTEYSLLSSRDKSGTAPSVGGSESVVLGSANHPTAEKRPCLIVASGWTGEVVGVADPGEVNGVAGSNIGKIVGVE